MTENNFQVIKGGLAETSFDSKKTFVSSYVTNTRLMGVIAVYIKWKLPENKTNRELHQFFYFDAEEYGLENYQSVIGDDKLSIDLIYHTMIGGLGSEKIPLTKREAVYMIKQFAKYNEEHNIPLPLNIMEYKFILEMGNRLTKDEEKEVLRKQCVEIKSEQHLCNYFLMRCAGRDFSIAKTLTCQDLKIDLFPEFPAATLCKNTVDRAPQDDAYLCESLIECNDSYHIVITHITVSRASGSFLVVGYKRVSTFKISPAEAGMMLSRPEYVTVYQYLGGEYEFNRDSTEFAKDALITPHEGGSLYMLFNKNNDHVNRPVYRLNEDVNGIYFVTKFNQLIAAAYDKPSIASLEQDIEKSPLNRQVLMSAKYEFQDPILFEFVNSNFTDFEEFVELIADGDEGDEF